MINYFIISCKNYYHINIHHGGRPIKKFEEIRDLLKREKDQRVNGSDFSKAVEAIGIDVSTGYKWVKRRNKGDMRLCLRARIKGGRPPELSKDDLEDLRVKSKDYSFHSFISSLRYKLSHAASGPLTEPLTGFTAAFTPGAVIAFPPHYPSSHS